jgi:hypothetical protein
VAAEFSFEGDTTPLNKLTIKNNLSHLSSQQHSPLVHKKIARDSGLPQTSEKGPSPPGTTLSAIYSSSFLSLKDFRLHYRHILHRAIVTRHTWPATATHGPLCRLCQRADERTFHMGTCSVIKEIFSNLTGLTSVDGNNPSEILLAFPNARAGTRCLAIIIWKFIIQHFYFIQTGHLRGRCA